MTLIITISVILISILVLCGYMMYKFYRRHQEEKNQAAEKKLDVMMDNLMKREEQLQELNYNLDRLLLHISRRENLDEELTKAPVREKNPAGNFESAVEERADKEAARLTADNQPGSGDQAVSDDESVPDVASVHNEKNEESVSDGSSYESKPEFESVENLIPIIETVRVNSEKDDNKTNKQIDKARFKKLLNKSSHSEVLGKKDLEKSLEEDKKTEQNGSFQVKDMINLPERYIKVFELANSGMNEAEIAEEMNMGVRETQLILRFYRKKEE